MAWRVHQTIGEDVANACCCSRFNDTSNPPDQSVIKRRALEALPLLVLEDHTTKIYQPMYIKDWFDTTGPPIWVYLGACQSVYC